MLTPLLSRPSPLLVIEGRTDSRERQTPDLNVVMNTNVNPETPDGTIDEENYPLKTWKWFDDSEPVH